MKAILKFTLPEESEEFTNAINGVKWKSVVWEIRGKLREQLKYNDSLTDKEYDYIESIQNILVEAMEDNNLTF